MRYASNKGKWGYEDIELKNNPIVRSFGRIDEDVDSNRGEDDPLGTSIQAISGGGIPEGFTEATRDYVADDNTAQQEIYLVKEV